MSDGGVMGGKASSVRLLPRLADRETPTTAVWNALGLLATALTGAGLVHLLAYHIPTGLPLSPRWMAAALTLLAHCPLVGPLGLIAAIAVAAPLLAFREIRRLDRLGAALAQLLRARRVVSPARSPDPRSFGRLLALFTVVLSLQVALLALAAWIDPMQTTMVMGGRPMTMAATSVLPMGLLHLVVAALLALLLWRVEHRMIQAQAEVARRLRLLAARDGAQTDALICSGPTHLPAVWAGLTLFARPPPRPATA